VVHVIEVYHYPEKQWSTYDRKDEKTGMFTEYINSNLKKKQQASGWPAWVQTDEQKAKYIKDYKEHEKIDLDEDSIERNEGMRALSKLMLNSFWVSCWYFLLVFCNHVYIKTFRGNSDSEQGF
jgi:hypothetical protein